VKVFLIKYLMDFQSGNDREGELAVCDGEGGCGKSPVMKLKSAMIRCFRIWSNDRAVTYLRLTAH